MRIIKFLLIAYFLAFPFGQFNRFFFEYGEINLYFTDIFVGIIVLLWLTGKFISKETISLPFFSKQIFLFLSISIFSLIFNSIFSFNQNIGKLNGRELLVSWLYLVRWIVYASLYFVISDLSKNERLRKKIVLGLMAGGVAVAFFGLLQYIFLPDTRFLESSGWDPHYYRLIGTFFDPGFTGLILVFTLILLTSNIIRNQISFNILWKEKIKSFLWLIIYTSLALTYSRASYLAYLISMGVLSFYFKSARMMVFILFLGFVTILVLPRPGGEGVRLERESTIKYRIINWNQSLQMIKENFVFGVGFNAYRYRQRDAGFLEFANWKVSHAGGGADSSLLFVFATTGIFGFLAYLWLWGRIFVFSLKQNFVLISFLTALLTHSFFLNSQFYPWIIGWFWIYFGTRSFKEQN